MANTASMKTPLVIKRKHVYRAIAGLFVVIAAFFSYTYFINKNLIEWKDRVQPGTSGQPVFLKNLYGPFGGGEFNKPMAVTVINERIYVSDTMNQRVQAFSYEGTPLFKIGKRGSKPGEFLFPYGLAGDKAGNLYVADLYNGTISIFDNQGKFLRFFPAAKGDKKTVFAPSGLAIANEKLFVTDVNLHKLMVFDLNGKLLQTIGKKGIKAGEMYAPNAVAVDLKGNIYVSDTGNQRIQMFDESGKFVKVVNGSKDGKGSSVFVNPRGVGTDARGTLYVISNLTHFVYGFDENGKQLFNFGGLGDLDKQFTLPNGLFVDESGRLYITDTMNQRVAIYQT